MSLLDISQVTRALIKLIETHVQASPIWPDGLILSVLPDPPDRLSGDNSLGVYLYHIQEDPSNKNILPAGNSQPPIRYTPMPILLYYQLSAHSDLTSPTGSYREQLILGAALKALHDYPIINDSTNIEGVDVFPAVLQDNDNRLAIELRPVGPDEAVNFWTAGSSPLRLAAYYCVSVVMLQPEVIEKSAGPVLDYNIYALPGSRPFITSSSNMLRFTAPGETMPRKFQLTPAQVAVGETLELHGVNFISDETSLVLGFSEWEKEQEVEPLDWAMQVAAKKITIVVQATANSNQIVPGSYSVAVKTFKRIRNADGSVYDSINVSSRTSINIVPRLDTVSAPNASGTVNVTGYLFQHPFIDQGSLQIFIADERLREGDAGSLNPGEFAVTGASTLLLRLQASSAGTVPLRILINGAESVTHWLG